MTKKIFEAEFKAKEVIKFLEEAAKKLDDLTPLMRIAAHFLKSTVDENFKTEGKHTGEKWKEWSDNWKKQRMKQNRTGSILTLEGDLHKSIHSKASKTEAAVIAGTDYAAAHNFGCTKTVMKERENKKKRTITSFKCNMNMPRREFMRIDDTHQDELIADLTVKLTELLMEKGK